MKYTKTLFESIKTSLDKKQTNQESNQFKNFLKLEKNNTYIVRLIPDLEDADKTFYHYYSHTWESRATQKLINVFCPNTYSERCPIDEYRSKIWKSGNEEDKKEIHPIKRNENWVVKVFVVKDPTNPENQGEVKFLRYGRQLHNIIIDAISGEESEEFGEKIFDLSENGCNLKIKVTENEGGFATYTSSKFQNPSALEGATEDEIYEKSKELTFDNLFRVQSYEEIKKLLNIHWLEKSDEVSNDSSGEDTEDEIEIPKPSKVVPKKKAHEVPSVTEQASEDSELDALLKDLE